MYFNLKIFFFVIAYAITATIAYAAPEDTPLLACENQSFANAYYLIGIDDIAAVSNFHHLTPTMALKDGSNFSSQVGQRDRLSAYYDFDNLELLKANKELVHSLDKNLPVYRIERESVSYIDLLTQAASINRFEVKIYNKKLAPMDKHPLFSRIKRKQRPDLITLISNINKSPPISITKTLTVNSTEHVNFLTLFGIPYGAITLSDFKILNFGVPNTSLLLKFEIFSEKQDNLLKQEIDFLNHYYCRIDERFRMQFPHIKSFSWFGYAEYHQLAVDDLPSRTFFRKYPEIYSIGQIISLSFIGFLFIYLILGRYTRRVSYSKISKHIHHK